MPDLPAASRKQNQTDFITNTRRPHQKSVACSCRIKTTAISVARRCKEGGKWTRMRKRTPNHSACIKKQHATRYFVWRIKQEENGTMQLSARCSSVNVAVSQLMTRQQIRGTMQSKVQKQLFSLLRAYQVKSWLPTLISWVSQCVSLHYCALSKVWLRYRQTQQLVL